MMATCLALSASSVFADDPFMHLGAPAITGASQVTYPDGTTAVTSMDSGGTAASPQTRNIASGTFLLRPGVFWGGINITGGDVTLLPGRYVMAGGGFRSSGLGTVTGTNVFIYNTRDPYSGAAAAQYGDVSLLAYSSTLKAPSLAVDPYYGGLLVFNNRAATTTVSLPYLPASVQGSIYSVNGEVDITAGNVNAGLELVAKDIVFSFSSTNSGTLHAFRRITIPANKSLVSNGGLLETDGAGGVPFLPLGAVIWNSGTVTVNRLYLTNNGSSSLTFNAGLLQSEGTTVTNGVVFTVGDGVQSATLDLLGGTHTFANGLKLSTNASLIGSGDIIAGSATNFGAIAPGHSAGTLTFSGDLTLQDSSTLNFEIGGNTTNDYDRAWVGGILRVAGLLNVVLTNDYTGNAGDTFDLFNFSSATGTFSQTNLPSLGAGKAWNTDRLYTLGEIQIIPEPGIGALSVMGLAALARRQRNRGRH
jgi:hypothetical protein